MQGALTKQDDKTDDPPPEEQEITEEQIALLDLVGGKPTPRIIALYGEIEEEKCGDAVLALEVLKEDSKVDEEGQTVTDPVKFYISTFGGSAVEMFAVYDAMRMARENCEIHTYGMGQRRIGANCRVMLHSVLAGHHGSLHDLENEVQEVKLTQKLWTKALLKETNMSETYLKRLMRKKMNIYFDAEKAIELGIADIIV